MSELESANPVEDELKNEMTAAAQTVAEDTVGIAAEPETVQADSEEPESVQEGSEEPQVKPATSMEDVISRLQEIVGDASNATRQELDQLKQTFYRLFKSKQDEQLKAFTDAGGAAENFTPEPSPVEEQYKKLMNIIREKRAAAQEALEAFRQENYVRKQEILERLRQLVEKANTEPTSYNDFKTILQEWKEIKEIPADKAAELWKNFQQYAEQFYDIQKLNAEFREYDFKKNLDAKIKLCEAAEKLADEPDVISAFHQLQKYHQEYREIGPVSKESREEVWNRFKAASAVVNRRHQQHFEEIKQAEQEHLEQKTAICEIVEDIDYDKMTKFTHWNEKTQEIIALQAKWKTIGYAPQKMNNKIFERFRTACDTFFNRKAEFFKQSKDGMSENLARKQQLCEQAEALKDSTDWKETGDKIAELQKQWKEIGPVMQKYTNSIWKRFIGACNEFYDKRDKTLHAQRFEENENLKKKKEILEKLKAYDPSSISSDDEAAIQGLISEWAAIGHVPFKFKDSIQSEYKRLYDILKDSVNLRPSRFGGNQRQSQRSNNDSQSPRERLQRQYDALKSEIQTYENNLGFLKASSKRGNSLADSIMEKVEKLKADAEALKKQIREAAAQESAESTQE